MKKTYILLVLFAAVIVSCTKLEETVYDKIPGTQYPENEAQIANLSVESYARLRPFVDDEGWWFLAQEIASDELCGPTRGADWLDGGKWVNMYKHEWSNDIEGVNRMWQVIWDGITSCNQTIDMMKDLPQNLSVASKMKELEVLRSFYYYLLIDNYGDAPYLTSAANAPAMPHKISRAAIYDSLVSTVTRNLPFLKPLNNKYMVTRYTGFALLAKLYLNAEQYKGVAEWAKASQFCDSVMTGPYSMEATVAGTFKTNNQASSEIIFSIPYDEDNFKGFRLHMRTLHYQHNLRFDMPVGPWNGFCAVPDFFNQYDNADLRKAAYFIYGPQFDSKGNVILDGETHKALNINPNIPALSMQAPAFTIEQIRTTGARVGKYEIKMGAKENLSNDFPLFRLTDFKLMKAEALIRLGLPGADALVNEVRSRAGLTPLSGVTLAQLYTERGKEMFCEGHRRQDMIRFGKYNLIYWEKSNVEISKNIYPIPKWATDANPNLL